PAGVFATGDGQFVAVVVIPRGGMFGGMPDRLVAQVRAKIGELSPARFHPHLQVGLSGDIFTDVEERRALEHDLAGASALAVGLVCLVVVLFFGRARALPLMAVPAALGVLTAFGLGELAFGSLNSST